jgi:signal transduction histidine kinase
MAQRTTPSGDLAMSRRQISYRQIESCLARALRERAETIAKLLCDGLAHSARALARAARWSTRGGRAAAADIARWRREHTTARKLRAAGGRQRKDICMNRGKIDHVPTLVAASPTGRLDRTMPGTQESAAENDDVAHALRTPLTSIRSFSEILRDDPDLPHATRERFLEVVVTESQSLDRAIEQLLHIRPPA